MKKFFCLLCLLTITSLSVVCAASVESKEPAVKVKNARYSCIVPSEEQEAAPTFSVINTETGYAYSSEEEFYTEERTSGGIVRMDLVNHVIYLIPDKQE